MIDEGNETRTNSPTGQSSFCPDDVVPRLQLLGRPQLLNTEMPPPRSARRCLELITLISLTPGATVALLADALDATPASIRWAIVQARHWLGTRPDGQLWLPVAYTGGYQLRGRITSDLAELLDAATPPVLSNEAIGKLLQTVNGPVFAGEAAGRWGWAEEHRITATERIRDLAHELGARALQAGDLSTARWAASRGLHAVPADELLLTDRLHTEMAAGALAEVTRIADQIRHHAARLDIDPLEATRQALTAADRMTNHSHRAA